MIHNKVLLINSPRELLSSNPKLLHDNKMPLGLLYIAAFLRQKQINTDLLDAEGLGLGISDIVQKIDQGDYKWVGLNCFSGNRFVVYEICKTIKVVDSTIKIVIGGPHPTLSPTETLTECDSLDYVVFGEGENSFYNLVSETLPISEIRGIGYKLDDSVVINKQCRRIQNLDDLPFPIPENSFLRNYTKNFSELEPRIYNKAFVLASRGCPYSCPYCASPNIWQKKLTHRSAENVIQEILIYLDLGIDRIHFYDDNITLWSGLHKFCEMAQEKNLIFHWGCSARIETLTAQLAQKMADSGCWAIAFGLESGSTKTLQRIRKSNPNRTLSKVVSTINFCKKAGIEPRTHFMIGFPWETISDIEETMAFALLLKQEGLSDANFLVVKPYMGTELHKEFTQNYPSTELIDQSQYISDWTDEKDIAIASKLRRFNEIPFKSIHPYLTVWDLRAIVRNMYVIFKNYQLSDEWRQILWNGVNKKSITQYM